DDVRTLLRWRPPAAESPYLVLMAIWDQRSQDHSASDEYGRLIVPPGSDDAHVIRGDDLAQLAAAIGERPARHAAVPRRPGPLAGRLPRAAPVTGGLRLADDFLPSLEATMARFNELAAAGK